MACAGAFSAKFSVLTFNVWFSRRDYVARAALLFDQIALADADVVALQEVTPRFLSLLIASPLIHNRPAPAGAELSTLTAGPSSGVATGTETVSWPSDRPRYHLCHTQLSALKPNGTAMLTRWAPERIVENPFAPPDDDMDRGLLAVVLRPPGPPATAAATAKPAAVGPSFVLGTVWLESPQGEFRGGDNACSRKRQLATALAQCEVLAAAVDAAAVVIAGDFNATRADEEAAWIAPPWRDVWLDLKALDDGFTYDCDLNPAASQYQSRLDKIIYCDCGTGARLRPTEIELVGEMIAAREGGHRTMVDPYASPPRAPPPPPLQSSDHFGLITTFHF